MTRVSSAAEGDTGVLLVCGRRRGARCRCCSRRLPCSGSCPRRTTCGAGTTLFVGSLSSGACDRGDEPVEVSRGPGQLPRTPPWWIRNAPSAPTDPCWTRVVQAVQHVVRRKVHRPGDALAARVRAQVLDRELAGSREAHGRAHDAAPRHGCAEADGIVGRGRRCHGHRGRRRGIRDGRVLCRGCAHDDPVGARCRRPVPRVPRGLAAGGGMQARAPRVDERVPRIPGAVAQGCVHGPRDGRGPGPGPRVLDRESPADSLSRGRSCRNGTAVMA